ncbi:hypothetical protein D1BOALGB6SA_2698 [Olavius sp. associated proteobacterium Delta 1]|nr:hypothetical protein D1BOALGB6SA_2698 [Olavius sp. associated proteobacterium Delta 1]
MMKGFFNRLLIIDLTSQTSVVEVLDESIAYRYLGGKGLGTHLLLERNPVGVDPLAPDAHVIYLH